MGNSNSKKRVALIMFSIIAFLVIGIFTFIHVIKADSAANKITIKNIKMTGIETGTYAFDDDGLNYDNQSITGYIPGSDSSVSNRIVRSFDELKYNFEFRITDKDDDTIDYDERTVNIKVTIPDSISKYVSFEPNINTNINTYTYSFNGIDTYDSFNKSISLYVLGAPNGTIINPKFEIEESTNEDDSYIVTLGSTSFEGEDYNYEFDLEDSNRYKKVSSVAGFTNYMPTIVSSKEANIAFKLLPQVNEGQKVNIDEKRGRYLTYVLGIELVGNDLTNIKGLSMPYGDITFDIETSQVGNETDTVLNNEWGRLYGTDNTGNIESVEVSLPYSASTTDSRKKIFNAGTVSLSNKKVTISDYQIPYSQAKLNADGTSLADKEQMIGTYAFTVFSERKDLDKKNDITSNFKVKNIVIKDTNENNITIDEVSSSNINKYYEFSDYSLIGEFYNTNGNKLSNETNGKGETSRGTSLVYKTTFNYKNTGSTDGFKEIIKIDSNAFRVLSFNSKDDILINVESSDSTFTKDNLDIKFVTGDFNNENYILNESFNRINSNDLEVVTNNCTMDLSSLNSNQIMNLYGGPCIKAKNNTESIYDNIGSAVTSDNKEIPITKIIIQTKNGVKLPNDIKITVDVSLRVKNVSDITRTYQVTAVASTSDSDDELLYYAPRIENGDNSITNPNNYNNTVYQSGSISSIDLDSTWGDSLRLVNYILKQEISVNNKNTDGTVKTTYNVNNGETLYYNIKNSIIDNTVAVGADDSFYVNDIFAVVMLPAGLQYVKDENLDNYLVDINTNENYTYLTYRLPATKPNMPMPDINFKAIIDPSLKGTALPITVKSNMSTTNINKDDNYHLSTFTIYATGIENIIVSQKLGNGSVIEKDTEFSYLLSAYNNTIQDISDYSLIDILPSNKDINGSIIDGSYKTKVTLPNSIGNAKVLCSTQSREILVNDPTSELNEWKECNITNNYESVTAILIKDISIAKNTSTEDIKVTIKPTGNSYNNKYINSFVGGTRRYSLNESNKLEVRVISRTISGRIFIDNDEDGALTQADSYLKDIPVTLYKIGLDNTLLKIDETVTDENGLYVFTNLDVGKYKVRAVYDGKTYDLTYRYQSENEEIDSDGYKVQDGIAEISNKRTPDESDGIRLSREIESISNMNIGLINKKDFSFKINKFITRVDLSYDNMTISNEYLNQKFVKEEVRNTLTTTSKVYYGIKIENDSSVSGYVKVINESIPKGAIFDDKEPLNEGWFYSEGELRNISLSNDLILPGESRYLQIVLTIPPQREAGSYINTVSLLEIERYEAVSNEVKDTNAPVDRFELGESVTYAGINWHVVNVANNGDDQVLTLLEDSNVNKGAHSYNNSTPYKWSDSILNNRTLESFNGSVLYDTSICNDTSGLVNGSYGGTLQSDGTCTSNIYTSSKVRLLSEKEFLNVKNSNIGDLSWLYGDADYWLMNSVSTEITSDDYNSYGELNSNKDVSNKAKYVSKTYSSVLEDNANKNKEIRRVITISNKNIILE